MREAFAQLARFGVTQENGIAQVQLQRSLVTDRRLHLARAFQSDQARARWQVGPGRFLSASCARGNVATTKTGIDSGMGPPHNLDCITSGGLIVEIAIEIEQTGRVEAGANRNFGHFWLSAS